MMTIIEDKEIIKEVLEGIKEPSEETVKRNKEALELLNKLVNE